MWFRKSPGLLHEQVTLLTSADGDVTVAKLSEAIRLFLDEQVAHSEALIYFTGLFYGAWLLDDRFANSNLKSTTKAPFQITLP